MGCNYICQTMQSRNQDLVSGRFQQTTTTTTITTTHNEHAKVVWNLTFLYNVTLHWRHNEHDGVSNHHHDDCLLNRLFRHRSRKTSKLRVTGLCEGNSAVIGEFPAQRASTAENVSIWWRHHSTQCHGCNVNLCVQCVFPGWAVCGDVRGARSRELSMSSDWVWNDQTVLEYGRRPRCAILMSKCVSNFLVTGTAYTHFLGSETLRDMTIPWKQNNFVVTGGTVSCHSDNLRCYQWRQSSDGTVSCHYDNLRCHQWRPSCQIDAIFLCIHGTCYCHHLQYGHHAFISARRHRVYPIKYVH